ncbi:GNAT family N-acetyltransferase [Geodermatophilus sp. CPCC 206100]|uniref:GNAT family N-acetyltransferase n=1 Tax=Geodermatophilus sp. CPCC 206100 TaxID=3020054 RepID=UPI003B002880
MDVAIRPLTEDDVDPVVTFAVEAWAPVFESFAAVMGSRAFALVYPDWRATQAAAVAEVCRADDTDVWVADVAGRPVGFVAVRWTEEGATPVGEVDMIAVDPRHQRAGIAGGLLDHAVAHASARGVPLVVIGTGGDPGHAPARALYEGRGFTGLPLVRYYRAL